MFKPLIKAKLKDRVQMVATLTDHVHDDAIPQPLGGRLPYDNCIHKVMIIERY